MHAANLSYCANSVTDFRFSRCLLLEVLRHQDAHRDDIGVYIALPSLLSAMELFCATGPMGSCNSKTSAEANNSDTPAKNKSRERVGEGDSETDREGGRERGEREGEAERAKERLRE